MRVEVEGPEAGAALPLRLAHLHWELPVGAALRLEVASSPWSPEALHDLVIGGGFDVDGIAVSASGDALGVRATRARTLPDTVGPGMRILVCGLNPSLVAADAGYGYAGRSNRFWPAAETAGLVSRARDPVHALVNDGVGMTDLVKRATPAASALHPDEYRLGLLRVERLVEWLRPQRVLFVGLAGWRASAGGRTAGAGWQAVSLGGVATYVMPSTSGLNAHTRRDELVAHFRTALEGAEGPTGSGR
ncbi:MAG: mismatch-specific DNA-glycosylase [Acidimicrobiales bacterium]